MTIIRDHARLTDAWTATDHSSAATATSPPSSSSSRRSPDPVQDAIHKYGITADSPLNTYTAGKPLDAHAREHLGKRLDYIFYRNPLRADYDPDAALLTAKETKVVFTGKVPQYDFSFSDHFGLECTFEVRTYGDTDSHPGSPFEPLRESALSPASISSTIQMLTSAYRLSVARARRELTTCALCVLVLCGAVVGSAWLPPRSWVAPLLLLCTIFVAWLATTMLYEGFIYGRWEQNALRSLIEELEVHRKVVLLRERQQRASP
jgi:sphingomyelin phosphodiesterase 2